jgi:hypothetical protein
MPAGEILKRLKISPVGMPDNRAAQVFFQFIIARIKLYYTCSHSLDKLQFRGLLFSSRHTLTKGTVKRDTVIFNDRNGLQVTEQDCNQTYHLQSFLD